MNRFCLFIEDDDGNLTIACCTDEPMRELEPYVGDKWPPISPTEGWVSASP